MSRPAPRTTRTRAVVVAAVLALTALALPAGADGLTAAPSAARAAGCPAPVEPGFTPLFDGTAASLQDWRQSGPGGFTLGADCTLSSAGGLGLYWYAAKGFRSYTLKLDWKLQKLADNSGIFLGFTPNGNDTHNRAITHGYEIQIDQLGRSDGAPKHLTGAIYDIQGPTVDTRTEVVDPLDWNSYEITVDSPKITVKLNGVVVNEYLNASPRRVLTEPSFIGLQNHGEGDVAQFRDVRIQEIEPGTGGGGTGAVPLALASLRNNVGIDSGPTSGADFDGGGFAYNGALLRVGGVAPGSAVVADGLTYTWPSSASGTPDNVVARGQALRVEPAAGATRVGLLASAGNGPVKGAFVFHYLDADGEPVRVVKQLSVSDWTLGGGAGSPAPGNTIAITTSHRSTANGTGAPEAVDTHVFSIAVPLEPGLALQHVELPAVTSGSIHLFDVTTG